MHEMAVTQSMLELVLAEAAKARASRVTLVNVVLGEMTGVVADCVQAYFDLMSRYTIAEGAALSFRRVPREAHCRNCAHLFRPDEICWACPECQSAEFEITAGNELYIESIEVE